MTILLVGLSTRAIAESASQGGNEFITLDYFGDRDQRERVKNYSLLRDFEKPFSTCALLEASRSLEFDSVVYIANLENHPGIVQRLGARAELLGNTANVLRQVRDWRQMRRICHEEGIPCAPTLFRGEERAATLGGRWLSKTVRSGGGHSIHFWNGEPLGADRFLQRYVPGRSASAVFASNGKNSVVLGISEQLIGLSELGARRFMWCGNILPLPLQTGQWGAIAGKVEAMAAHFTHRFGLKGVNGFDFIVAEEPHGVPCPVLVEVNPRFTASMELVERACGLNIFSVHLEAVAGKLPVFSLAQHFQNRYFGKGIVFARRTLTIPEGMGGLASDRRDIPYPGDRIEAGHPVCTVLAEGNGPGSCLDGLLANAAAVRNEIGDQVEE